MLFFWISYTIEAKKERSEERKRNKMGLKIIYGKPGSGKSQYCFQKIAEEIKTQQKIYMITPEQFSFTAETKLMRTVKNQAIINAEVLTLSRMAYRVLNEVGGSSRTQLTKQGKAMLIYNILNQNKKQLKFLGKSDENIEISMRSDNRIQKAWNNSRTLKKRKRKNTRCLFNDKVK